MDSQDNVDEDQEEEEVMIQDGKESPSITTLLGEIE
jgi:hypothetical protein